MHRKEALATGEVYHIYNRSIAEFKIFNTESDFLRIKNMIRYYQFGDMPLKFSRFVKLEDIQKYGFNDYIASLTKAKEKIIQIVAYCFMPTHLHLILKPLKDDGISIFMHRVLDSYSRYFNTLHNRKGPLWQGRFKNVLVKTDDQLLHLTRYLHLNPVTAYLVKKPEEWKASSYKEYSIKNNKNEDVCDYKELLNIDHSEYKKFTKDNISYQRELSKIKDLIFD